MSFRIGTTVRLTEEAAKTLGEPIRGRKQAKIVEFFTDIKGGCRLDGMLWGFYCWNVADLERC